MDDFLKEFFPKVYRRKQKHLNETDYCKYDNQILTLFTSSLYFAALVSTFGASHVTRNKGRKGSIIVGSISFFLGAILNAAAVNIWMLIIGRVLLGVGIGFSNQVTFFNLKKMAFAWDGDLFILFVSLFFRWCRQFRCISQKWLRQKSVERLTNCFNLQPA